MPKGRMCPESGRATGSLSPWNRRRRCLLCGELVRQVVDGQHLVVSRHWPRGEFVERVFQGPQYMYRDEYTGPMCVCVERRPGDAVDAECRATYHFETYR